MFLISVKSVMAIIKKWLPKKKITHINKAVEALKIKEFLTTSFNKRKFLEPIEYPTIPSVENA